MQENTSVNLPPRRKMSAKDFKDIWEEKIRAGEEWSGSVKYMTGWGGEKIITFSNIAVEENIPIVKNESPLVAIILSNCFISVLSLNKAKAQSITIEGKTVVNEFRIWSCSEVTSLAINEQSKIKTLEISKSRVENAMWGNSIIGHFSVLSNSHTGNFNIWDFTIDSINLQKSCTGNFIVDNSQIKRFRIEEQAVIGHIFFENSETQDLCVRVENSDVEGFTFRNSPVKDLFLKSASRIGRIRAWGSSIKKIEVKEGCYVGYFQIQFNLQESGIITLTESNFGHLDLSDWVFPEFTTMFVANCWINQVSLRRFCNYGTIFFSDLKNLEEWEDFKKEEKTGNFLHESGKYQFVPVSLPSTLRLVNSDLGKVQFINCDLTQFQCFEFANTKMLDVFVAGSQMPEAKKFRLPAGTCSPEEVEEKTAQQKRLAYGQFKKIYEARGDTAGSLQYLAFEMEAYREQLRFEEKSLIKEHLPANTSRIFQWFYRFRSWILKRVAFLKKRWIRFTNWKIWQFFRRWFDIRSERTILWLNRISTYYGNNWHRGFWMTFSAIGICFTLFCWSLGYRFGNDWEKFWELVSCAPQYLNPFRDADSLLPDLEDKVIKMNPTARIIDYISRIIVAYFVYQTIQAFRKLGKSSG